LKTIAHIISRYTALLAALLKPLGSWGVFAIAGIDSSFVGMPLDFVVAGYIYSSPHKFLLYVLMASAGSSFGSLIIYGIGYRGGEALLRKRVSAERFEKIHNGFEEHPFWTLMLPAMLPPPTPFKLFVLGAGVSEMRFAQFLLAIFSGRFIRFVILGVLTLLFGPQFIDVIGHVFREHFSVVVGIAIGAVTVWLIMRQRTRKRRQRTDHAA
jgi:membrane protein YqaA with SNARE-associated domain